MYFLYHNSVSYVQVLFFSLSKYNTPMLRYTKASTNIDNVTPKTMKFSTIPFRPKFGGKLKKRRVNL